MIYRYITGFNEKFNKILFWNGIIFTWYFTNDKVFHFDFTCPYHILEKRAVIGRFFLLQLRMLRQLLGLRLWSELFVCEVDRLKYCEAHLRPMTCACTLWHILYEHHKRRRSAQKKICIPLCHFAVCKNLWCFKSSDWHICTYITQQVGLSFVCRWIKVSVGYISSPLIAPSMM